MSRSINLAVIPGDGIGQEVVAQGLKVLSAVLPQDVKLETKEYDFGARRCHPTGETLPDADLDALKNHDAILLGAIGDPSVPSGVLERGLPAQAPLRLRPLRQPASVEAAPRRRDPAGRPAPTSTSSSSARAPRARTPATAARSAQGTEHEVATEVSREHGVRRRARRPRRVRPRPGPPPQEADAGPQEQRARLRRPPVDEHLRQGRRGVPRGHHRLPARRRGDDLPRHPARALRRHRHRQPFR